MLTPMKAIKTKCLEDCCAGQESEWKNCPITTCPLYPYRLGKNPNRKGIGGNPNIAELGRQNKKHT